MRKLGLMGAAALGLLAASPASALDLRAVGTGFVVDGAGHVLTNRRVALDDGAPCADDRSPERGAMRLIAVSADEDLAPTASGDLHANYRYTSCDEPLSVQRNIDLMMRAHGVAAELRRSGNSFEARRFAIQQGQRR